MLLLMWSALASALVDGIQAPEVNAGSYVLLETLTGEVIAEKNPDEPLAPASLVKIMTAYLAFKAIDENRVGLEDLVTISKKARSASGSRMFLEVGSEVSFQALLLGLIVQSGNDAAIAIAEHLAGSEEEFVELMNREAIALGMHNTIYGSSTGLPKPRQATSARDLAILSRRMILDYPDLYSYHAVREYEHNGILQQNRNKLLEEYAGADGIKTGYTRTARYCLAASAVRHGMRLVGVIMAASSPQVRAREMEKLFNFGFNNYRAVELFVPGQNLDEVKVYGGTTDRVAVGYAEDEPLRMLLSRTQANGLRAVLKSNSTPVEAPVTKGEQIASIEVMAGEQVLAEIPAVALADVNLGTWWIRVVDYVRLHWLRDELPVGTN